MQFEVSVINEIKEKVKNYQDIVIRKDKLNQEFQSWIEIYKGIKPILAKVRAAYELAPSEETKHELDKWLKEEKDYLEIFEEYAVKFNEINQELHVYDAKTIEDQSEFLAKLTEQKIISKKIKDIEKRSKKLAGNYTIHPNLIPLESAEGRTKYIYAYFADEYQELCQKKRIIAKELKLLYNKSVNRVYVNLENENDEMQLISPPAPEVVYDENYYDRLTNEDKIKELEARMDRMKKASGRKQRIKCHGEIIELPRAYVGQYISCAAEIRKLQQNNSFSVMPENINEEFIDINTFLPNKEDYPETMNVVFDPIDYNNDIDQSESIFNVSIPPQRADGGVEIKVIEAKGFEFDKENEELMRILDANSKKTAQIKAAEEEKKKAAGFKKIKNIRKSKDKNKLKNKVKKVAFIAAATLVMASSVIIAPISALLKGDTINRTPDLDDVNNKDTISVESTAENITTFKDEPTFIEQIIENAANFNNSQTVENIKENHYIELASEFVVLEDAQLYSNVYDATLQRNGLTPGFSNDAYRTIGGVAINYEGELKFFYANDPNAQENINILISAGGKVTSVLAQNEAGYEGFYNIGDVQTLNNVIGGSRR